MKACVFIMGTNGTGKTSVARALIAKFGGVSREEESGHGVVSITAAGVAFAGRYEGVKFGGVDYLGKTSGLSGLASYAFTRSNALVCEGMYMGSFGKNLTSTMYQAEARLAVLLYANHATIDTRLAKRSGTGITEAVMKKQQTCANAARKYASSGCSALSFDTDIYDCERIAETIAGWIRQKI